MTNDIVIVGAGPSGLTAAHEVANHGARTTVVEQLENFGGLARTIEFRGSRFDIGAHRFFTRNIEVNELFTRILGDHASLTVGAISCSSPRAPSTERSEKSRGHGPLPHEA